MMDGIAVFDFGSHNETPQSITDVVSAYRSDITTGLREHGAVLLRAFGELTVDDFSRAASNLLGDVVQHNGEHEPANERGDVQTPVPYDANKKLLWHNENSFNQ